MAYKIPGHPSIRAYTEEIADFWEIQAILNPSQHISNLQISKILSIGLDEHKLDGIESEDDDVELELQEVFYELEQRRGFTAHNYPFKFKLSSIQLDDEDSFKKDIYLYLLLCTRFNMQKNKVQNGIDGTLLFEELCVIVASNYLRVDLDHSYIFGTANSGNFEDKVRTLIKKIGEGQTFKNPNNNSPTAKDGGVDIVTWKDFADNRPSKLIAFGQCKTGTSWRDEIHKLKPRDFCDNWLYESPVHSPIPLVFITDTLNADFNDITSIRGFLVFNRFRIVEYLQSNVSEEIKLKVRNWLQGALETLKSLC